MSDPGFPRGANPSDANLLFGIIFCVKMKKLMDWPLDPPLDYGIKLKGDMGQ